MKKNKIIPFILVSLLFTLTISIPFITNTNRNIAKKTDKIGDNPPLKDSRIPSVTKRYLKNHNLGKNEFPISRGFTQGTERRSPPLSTASKEKIQNISNQGWSWRPPSVMNQTEATYSQERDIDESGGSNWVFRNVSEGAIATGQYIEVVKSPSENVSHIFVANRTKINSNESSYFRIQHWTCNYHRVKGEKTRYIQPKLQFQYSLAARSETDNTIMSFVDLSARAVWNDTIFLSYVILERTPDNNTTATLYTRIWKGESWNDPKNITSTPLNGTVSDSYMNVSVIKDLSIYYNSTKNLTLVNLLGKFNGFQIVGEYEVSYSETDLFCARLAHKSKFFNISRIPIDYSSEAGKLLTAEYRIGAPLFYNTTLYGNNTYFPMLKVSDTNVTLFAINVSLTLDDFSFMTKLYSYQSSTMDIRPGPVSGVHYILNSLSSVSISWILYYGESSSECWLTTSFLNKKTWTKINTSSEVLSPYNAGNPQHIAQNSNYTYLFYLDLSPGYQEAIFHKYGVSSETEMISNRATEGNTTTIEYDAKLTRKGGFKGSFLIGHIAYREINGNTEPVTLLTLGFNDTDHDGLGNVEENQYYSELNVSFEDADTDDDGINDGAELFRYDTHPNKADTDEDTLGDYEELILGTDGYITDPTDPDTDGDGLYDDAEMENGTNPLVNDMDGDGLTDYEEIVTYAVFHPDPTEKDPDGDGLTDLQEVEHNTRCDKSDTDSDGISDYEEIFVYETNATDLDTDGDRVNDSYELVIGTDPNLLHSDGDRLNDSYELVIGTDPRNEDTDRDGLSDSYEILNSSYDLNPLKADTDGDGLDDASEVNIYANQFGCDPTENDTDNDNLTDSEEVRTYRTLCNTSDTDGDGLSDYEEVEEYFTLPKKVDSDNDGLTDGEEVNTFETDPNKPDTDGDGLLDGAEVNTFNTDPNDLDTDNDGLSDGAEIDRGTDPNNPDTDGDGVLDGTEVSYGLNPTERDSNGDFVPDTIAKYIPLLGQLSFYWIVAAVIIVILLVKAWSYGFFKSLESEAAGMSGEGGTLLFALNRERIEEVIDPSLFASSLTGSFYLLQENLGVEQDYLVMGKEPQVIVSKQGRTFLWVQTEEAFPRLISKVKKVHKAVLDEYEDLIDKYGMMPQRLSPVREFLNQRLPLHKINRR